MNLRTSLQISAVFPIVLAFIVALSLVVRSRQISETQNTLRMSDSFALSVTADVQAAEVQSRSDILFAVFIAVIGLILAGATLAISRDVAQRISLLNEWTGLISEGKFEAKPEIARRNDEVGQLTRAFAEMTRKLNVACQAREQEISEHKQAEKALRESNMLLSNALEKLKRAQHQIIQQERLHVLEQVVRGITHDFNNTLTPILGISDFLLTFQSSLQDKAVVLENISAINEAARKARDDVKTLSEFFQPRKSSGLQPIDINTAVKHAVELTKGRWGDEQYRMKRGEIAINMQLGVVPPTNGLFAELREVLVNLILNAVEAMPQGGTITIVTRLCGNMTRIDVTDTGEGMTEEVRHRCLEPFFSTKDVEGTGMGLTIVNNTVRRHGGTLAIQSEKGTGTTVTITLPAATAPARLADKQTGIHVTRELRILVIDDESWSREVESKLLIAGGHQVDTAGNGEGGLRKLESSRYDVVITDMAMPDMSGEEVAKAVKQKYPHVSVILVTGFGDIMKEEETHPEGVDWILSKPITLADLSHALAAVVGQNRGNQKE